MKKNIFIAVKGQYFTNREDWIMRATPCLTSHPDYFNAEHEGDGKKGWRGNHFTAMCFDQRGRRCKIGADFARAQRDKAYPVWWIWPDQIAEFLMRINTPYAFPSLYPEKPTEYSIIRDGNDWKVICPHYGINACGNTVATFKTRLEAAQHIDHLLAENHEAF